MSASDLTRGRGRVGWLIDGVEDTPAVPALLLDDGKRITLTIAWRTDTGHDQLERWFSGRSVRFGDDPDYSRFTYSLPDCLWFQDVDGEVALVGCRSVGLRRRFTGAHQGAADVRFAVLDGTTDYSTLNGLRSELPGLGEWVGVSSIEENATLDGGRRVKTVDVHLGSPDEIPLSRALGLKLRPRFRITRSPEVDATTLHDSLQIETLVREPRPWIEHLRAHNSVRDLMQVSGWSAMPWGEQWVHRLDDPERVLPGEAIGPKWANLRSHDLRPSRYPSTRTPSFLFGFRDIGAAGYRRWKAVRDQFKRGLDALIPLAGTDGGFIETEIAQSGMGFEALGYVLAQEAGLSEKRAGAESHIARLERIASDVSDGLIPEIDTWPQRSSDAYNGVKHANRDMPDFLELANVQRENCLAFCLWVASRIGVSHETLGNRLRIDPMARPYQRE